MVFVELTHGLGGYEFPDLAWVFERGVKAVVYCATIDLQFRFALYGWNRYPAGVRRLDNVQMWNSLTSSAYNQRTLELFKDNPDTSVIIATIAFGMGMNVRNITNSINLGLPDMLEVLMQQNGRAGRDLRTESRGWTYVEGSLLSSVRKAVELESAEKESSGTVVRPSRALAKAVSRATTKRIDELDPNLNRLLQCHVLQMCLIAETNIIFGNPGPEVKENCKIAGHSLECSGCNTSWNSPPTVETSRTVLPIDSGPTPRAAKLDPLPTALLPPHLSKPHRADARSWLDDFARKRWALKNMASARYLPASALWSGITLEDILDHFHLLRTVVAIRVYLSGWKYCDDDDVALCHLTNELNQRYDKRIQKAKKAAVRKAKATCSRNKGLSRLVSLSIHSYSLLFELYRNGC
ncbi:hypothetical protein Hypma_004155 [Hypsizygus marmoreus]|uniref:DNA 3'-5' helicase n=1 Tax=Hypsizygus marmoreus TaxID=39966 RepID=A0A369J9B2_HYPMA|nr:hypothetical protein Hypma_004155 [Hypsizygus marmoreus]